MNKKFKYTSLVAAGAVTLGLVGGTLAWFTSTATQTNKFATGDVNENTTGIIINENFVSPDNMVPGDDVTKDVQVTNTASYDQFVRAKIQVMVTPKDGEAVLKDVILVDGKYVVDGYKDIQLHFKQFGDATVTQVDGKDKLTDDGAWTPLMNNKVDYFYYLGKVKADDITLNPDTDINDNTVLDINFTSSLLKSVELVAGTDLSDDSNQNDYHGMAFDVIVKADSIQASNDAYLNWVTDDTLKAAYRVLQAGNVTQPEDSYAVTPTPTPEA